MSKEITDKDTTAAENKEPYADLVENILEKLEFFISSKMEILFKEADESLFKAAQSATSIAVQNANFEFMNSLRDQKANIENSFVTEFNVYIKPIADIKELPKKKQHNQSNQLGLIEQDEMDEMVALKTISSKSAMDFREELSHLESRFEHLALQTRHIFHAKALQPQNICDAFQEAMTYFDLPSENKLALYKMFGEFLIRQLKVLYDELNQLMIAEDILPQIELSGKISKSESPEPQQHEAVIEEQQAEDLAGSPQSVGGTGSANVQQRSGHYSGGGSQQEGSQHRGGGSQQAGGGSQQSGGVSTAGGASTAGGSMGNSSAAQTGAAGGDSSGGRPAAQINQSIQGFVGGNPTDSDSAAQTGGSGGGGGFYAHGDVVSALSNIQLNEQLLPDTNLGFDANAIKKALLTAISDSKGGVVDKRVNQVSEKTIDFIKLIFDAIIDDKGISDTIKTLLLSLQIPIIKAAMIDADFFVNDEHPARQLLDKLAEAGVGVVDQQDPVYIDVERIVKKLLTEYKEDIAAFEEALIALTELTEEIYRKAQNQENVSQKEIQQKQARVIVLKEIRKITLGKELPEKIRTLVLKVWPSLMFNHFLKSGKANDEWVEMLMILDRIIDSVQPINSLSDLQELGLSSDDIINAAREKLSKCRKSGEVVDKVINDLKVTYDEMLATRETLEKAEAKIIADEKAAAEAAAKVEEKIIAEAATEEAAKSEAEAAAKVEAAAKQEAEKAKKVEEKAKAEARIKAAVKIKIEAEVKAQDAARAKVEAEKAAAEKEREKEEAKVLAEKKAAEAAAAVAEIEEKIAVEAAEEETAEQIAQRKIENLPADVQPGSWYIIYNGEDKPVRRLKLAVMLVQEATLVFVDHLGNVVIEKDAEMFTDELEKGLSGVIMQHSVFDHALNSALDSIKKN